MKKKKQPRKPDLCDPDEELSYPDSDLPVVGNSLFGFDDAHWFTHFGPNLLRVASPLSGRFKTRNQPKCRHMSAHT